MLLSAVRRIILSHSPRTLCQSSIHLINKNMASTKTGEYSETLEPLSWLFGKWTSSNGVGIYPTMADFNYGEDLEFFPIGMKPVVQYQFKAWKPVDKSPMHIEVGFIRLLPDTNKISFLASHVIGIVEIQEGEVNGQSLTVATTDVHGHDSFYKLPALKQLVRTLSLKEDCVLEQLVHMATERTPLTEHLRISYTKVTE